MKKILSLMLIIAITTSFAACSKKEAVKDTDEPVKETLTDNITEETEETEEKEEIETEQEDTPAAPSEKPAKPEADTQSQTPPAVQKPETPSQPKPEAPAETKPQESATTLGGTLVNEFKKIASSHSDALSVATLLSESKSIQFAGMATPVEPGFLTGFTDKEIHGFKEGAMFGPMIGTIPFVGYVFVTESESQAASLTETLRKNADLRWNLCTEAEEMLTATVGNKVFFVMCPKSME